MDKTLNDRVAAVMTAVRRLEKADKNAHGNYRFTSVDDFKDHLRPLMAKEGVSLMCDQTAISFFPVKNSKGGETLMAQFEFAFRLCGGADVGEVERSVVVLPHTGAQTTGAARSYAVKEYLKSRFMASAGDEEDADHASPGEYSRRASPPPIRREPVVEDPEAMEFFSGLQSALRSVRDVDQLKHVWTQNRDEIMRYRAAEPEMAQKVIAFYQQRQADLAAAQQGEPANVA